MLARLWKVFGIGWDIAIASVWFVLVVVWSYVRFPLAAVIALKIIRALWESNPVAWASVAGWVVAYVALNYFVSGYRPKNFSR